MQIILAIAFGGALGALGRFFLSKNIDDITVSNFPYGILICNIIGSLVLGFLYESFSKGLFLSDNIRIFLQAGILSSFTTFSAFSLEAYLMLEKGNYSIAAIFITLSVVLNIVALILGIHFYKIFG